MLHVSCFDENILTVISIDVTPKVARGDTIDPVKHARIMHYPNHSAVGPFNVKGLRCKVRALKKNDVGKVALVKHIVPNFQNILMHSLDCVSGRHEILVFVFSLKNPSANFLDIIPLVLRLTN